MITQRRAELLIGCELGRMSCKPFRLGNGRQWTHWYLYPTHKQPSEREGNKLVEEGLIVLKAKLGNYSTDTQTGDITMVMQAILTKKGRALLAQHRAAE